MGDPLLYKADVIKFEWVLCQEEVEERMDVSPFVIILDNFTKGNDRAFDNVEHSRQVNNPFLCIISWLVLGMV